MDNDEQEKGVGDNPDGAESATISSSFRVDVFLLGLLQGSSLFELAKMKSTGKSK